MPLLSYLMQQLLPSTVRHTLPGNVSSILITLCGFFRELCSKTKTWDHLNLQACISIMPCHFEMIFPHPSWLYGASIGTLGRGGPDWHVLYNTFGCTLLRGVFKFLLVYLMLVKIFILVSNYVFTSTCARWSHMCVREVVLKGQLQKVTS